MMSQNPNGTVELYDEDGVFMGTVATMADFIAQEKGEQQESSEE